jgi:hypothetical protein
LVRFGVEQLLHQPQGAAAEDQRQGHRFALPAVPVALDDRVERGLGLLEPLELVEDEDERLGAGERAQRRLPGVEAQRHAGESV